MADHFCQSLSKRQLEANGPVGCNSGKRKSVTSFLFLNALTERSSPGHCFEREISGPLVSKPYREFGSRKHDKSCYEGKALQMNGSNRQLPLSILLTLVICE